MSNRRSHLPAAWVCALCMTASPVFAAPGERLPVDAPGSRSAVATARHAATSPAVVVKDGRLSVRLENGSLGRVLEEISRQARVAIIDEGGDGRRRMSAQLQDVALDAVEGRPEALAIAEQALGDASPHVRSKAEEILRGADASTHPPSPSQSLQGRSPQPERR